MQIPPKSKAQFGLLPQSIPQNQRPSKAVTPTVAQGKVV
jgi:hypothetical protein